ncbi:MAG: type I restriction enzyme HsdR N-terminal domain-containing protein [Candidatus Sumerlaeaceae bacterium]|nr:type I restriction enzyme HsdR N-terminal domain-containing protein [Candidatus Sumerlaeaceae bacterium]
MARSTETKIYRREKVDVVWDECRGILVKANPEERIRQDVVRLLVKKLKVPIDHISTEEPAGNGTKGRSFGGRIDIVVWDRPRIEEEDRVPILGVEVKCEATFKSGSAWEQLSSYQQYLPFRYGAVAYSAKWGDVEFRDYNKAHGDVPGDSVGSQLRKLIKRRKFTTPSGISIFDAVVESALYRRVESAKTVEEKKKIISSGRKAELDTLKILYGDNTLRSRPDLFLPIAVTAWCLYELPLPVRKSSKTFGFQVLEDKGIDWFSNSNAGGGSWPGYYRSFLVKDPDGSAQVYRFSVCGCDDINADKYFGNRVGYTMLIVAIDDLDLGRHNSLQLRLDTFLEESMGGWKLTHDGTMTAGATGAVKRDIVLSKVKQLRPDRLCDSKVQLGSPFRTNAAAVDMMFRLMCYAYIRDKVRSDKRKA